MIHLRYTHSMTSTERQAAPGDATRWLVLIHQIPPKPDYLRVKIGRHLQRLGAVAIKNSVYVLPRTDQSQEDFEWVVREIADRGGDASVCEARFVDGLSDQAIEALFNDARDADYQELAGEARSVLGTLQRVRRIDGKRREEIESRLARLRKRLGEVTAIDFFGAGGREVVEGQIHALAERLRPSAAENQGEESSGPPVDVRGRTWVTRQGIHIDRMGSAWLIRRFIDPEARFKFVAGKGYRPESGEIRFDMFKAEFTHQGDLCTFEVLMKHFRLKDAALASIAKIVHDIDVKDAKFDRPDAPGIQRVITGIALTQEDDETRLSLASAVFESLYASFKRKR